MENTQLYNDLNTYLKKRFGTKVYKIALNAKVTCPNRDGTLGTGGCIFCSGGSGDFAGPREKSITEQIEYGKEMLKGKLERQFETTKFIAYFQSFTNTYAPIEYLEEIFREAVMNPCICALSIATRPDCISDEVLNLLKELNEIKPVWIELGLQTIHEKTAEFIRRGYALETYEKCLERLNAAGIETIVHVILGLPFEDKKMMVDTVDYVTHKGHIQGIKLQLLHVLSDTDLGRMFLEYGEDAPERLGLGIRTPEEYIELLAQIIRRLPEDTVVHRITGDAAHEKLLYPMWSANKRIVLNGLRKKLTEINSQR